MLTKEQIEDFANYDYAGKEKNLDNCQGFIDGATWANDQCAARIAELEKEIRDLQFRKEGDAVLLKAANQQIQKERNKMDILQGAYDTAKSHTSGLEAENEILRNEQTGLREVVSNLKMTVVDLEADKIELEAEKAELIDAIKTVIHGYETDGFEGMEERDNVFYKTCKAAILKK